MFLLLIIIEFCIRYTFNILTYIDIQLYFYVSYNSRINLKHGVGLINGNQHQYLLIFQLSYCIFQTKFYHIQQPQSIMKKWT